MTSARQRTPAWFLPAGIPVGLLFVLAAFGAAFVPDAATAAAWCMVLGLASIVHGTFQLGTQRGDDRGGLTPWVAATCVAVGFGGALALPASAPAIRGVPLATALIGVLVGIVPILLLPILFARGGRSRRSAPSAGQREDVEST